MNFKICKDIIQLLLKISFAYYIEPWCMHGDYLYRSNTGCFKFIFKVIVPTLSMCMSLKFINIFKYEIFESV